MITNSIDARRKTVRAVAELMATAAQTAPKGCGMDNVRSLIVDGNEKDTLSSIMREICKEYDQDFFERDACNVDDSQCVLLIGVQDAPIGLDHCGVCGFKNCGECAAAGSHCAFNITDLGIAVGSAVSVAADHRVDNRVLYSAGKAALRAGWFDNNVKVCYAVPLSAEAKNSFFDRGEDDE